MDPTRPEHQGNSTGYRLSSAKAPRPAGPRTAVTTTAEIPVAKEAGVENSYTGFGNIDVDEWIRTSPECRRLADRHLVAKKIRAIYDLPSLTEAYPAADEFLAKLRDGSLSRSESPLVTFYSEMADVPAGAVEVAPGVAYRGRAALVHAQRGAGKTTLLAWLVARASVAGVKTLVVGDDDPQSWRQRLISFGADLTKIGGVSATRVAPANELESVVSDPVLGWDWVVVDNWRTWAGACGIVDRGGYGDTAAASLIDRLVSLVRRDPELALTLIHNQGWHNDSRSRDSSVVEDAVDVCRRIVTDKATRVSVCEVAGKVRYGIPSAALAWYLRRDEAGYDPTDVPDPDEEDDAAEEERRVGREHIVDAFIDAHLRDHPDASARACYAAAQKAGLRVRAQDFYRWFRESASQSGISIPPEAPEAGPF